jgi:DNA polymerase III subunit delta
MPIYLFWGEDEFRLSQAVQTLEHCVLDPNWKNFNYDKVEGGTSGSIETLVQGLNQAMTPPFGLGDRMVWLVNPPLGGQESSVFCSELERTLPALPATSHLLLTYNGKPDGRSKLTKLLQQQATVREFSLAPPWKTDEIRQTVRQVAQQLKVNLTDAAVDLLLEKLKLYVSQGQGNTAGVVGPAEVAALVSTTQQSSLELANAIRQGSTDKALSLIDNLLRHNEPALRISATLIKQFRTWLWVKVMQQAGERDERAIAKAADIANPKRIYFLSQDVKSLSQVQLQQTLSILLDLEVALKQGQEAKSTLQTKTIELCQACRGF